ncbi:DUF4124 domain-containing protein [Eleftheria terrae]|uniref:DUF4124 domain-containing protein n=1 Tax=Eleftheria terrae TaxID=1597781 RepID=UPI00263A436F|nr:DUF4124 domain-containing protein [Eleftheria terrae]WKB50537.1 DUF4124 domain-containing protein [Eleftheria terrae]
MKRQTAALVLLASAAVLAHAEIYRHVDDHGNVTFSNIPPKGLVPALAEKVPAARELAAPPAARSEGRAADSVPRPKVAASVQAVRDAERRQILEREVAKEQELLAAATTKKDAEAVGRHQANLVALRAEMGRIK